MCLWFDTSKNLDKGNANCEGHAGAASTKTRSRTLMSTGLNVAGQGGGSEETPTKKRERGVCSGPSWVLVHALSDSGGRELEKIE